MISLARAARAASARTPPQLGPHSSVAYRMCVQVISADKLSGLDRRMPSSRRCHCGQTPQVVPDDPDQGQTARAQAWICMTSHFSSTASETLLLQASRRQPLPPGLARTPASICSVGFCHASSRCDPSERDARHLARHLAGKGYKRSASAPSTRCASSIAPGLACRAAAAA